MRFRSILIASLLLTAGIVGTLHKVTLPVWVWFVWASLSVLTVMVWAVVKSTVGWAVRNAVLKVPLSGRISERVGEFSIPVAEIHASPARIEAAILERMPFRPVAWLAARAFRKKTDEFLGSIVEHCKANGSDVFNARLFASWLHEKVAGSLAGTAADIASGFWMIAVIVLASAGLLFAMPHFQSVFRAFPESKPH